SLLTHPACELSCTYFVNPRGLTGRSTRTRSGKAPRAAWVIMRLAAPCRCVPVNSDVRRHEALRLRVAQTRIAASGSACLLRVHAPPGRVHLPAPLVRL